MDEESVGRVAVLAVHPEFADAILEGRKQVEFRKRPLAPDVTHVLIYSTKPVGAIVGAFQIRCQVESEPESLWSQFSEEGGIDKERFDEYFADCAKAFAICVGEVICSMNRVDLRTALGVTRPPQSYQYLESPRGRAILLGILTGTL